MAGGEDCALYQTSKIPDKGDCDPTDSSANKTLEDVKSAQKHNGGRAFDVENAGSEVAAHLPRPPMGPRLSKLTKRSVSLEATSRSRRFRNSQESLSDRAETGSSTDSLKEDQSVLDVRNEQDSAGSPVLQGRKSSLSECDSRPHSQHSVLEERLGRSAKVRLSPVQPTGPLPALNKNFTSSTLRAANRIDKDLSDYGVMVKEKAVERIHRNMSDNWLLETLEDSASVNSIKSIYSVLSPIRPQDMRNR